MNLQMVSEFFRLLLGTVIYRPYVYGFFICFLFFSLRHLKLKGTAVFLITAYAVAYLSEYSATRNGFPFGMYVYLDETRTRELWLSNIPFWDSLSFVFLSYFSWITASGLLRANDPNKMLYQVKTALLGGFLMMLLDIIIDPLTLLGDRWFLGKIYYYPNGGTYFGVTLSNFAGWWFVGMATLLLFQWICKKSGTLILNPLSRFEVFGSSAVYAGVILFNLLITAYIKEWRLLAVSSMIAIFTLTPIAFSHLHQKEKTGGAPA